MRIAAFILLPALLLSIAGTSALAHSPAAVIDPKMGSPETPELHAPLLRPSAQALDFALPNGRFFKQANGQGGAGDTGYPVVNSMIFANNVRFFDEFQRLGGVPLVGFPASRTFVLDGFVTQVNQKALFQWRPEVDQVFFINVFDILHDRGFDPFLLAFRSVPPQLPTSFDAGKTIEQIVNDRLALLNANPSIRSTYFSVDDPLLRFGLPTSRVEDMGNHFAIRLQRAVLQQWKVNVPWAQAGQVTIANGGDVFKELNQVPAFAVVPQPTPSFSQSIVVYEPAQGAVVRSPIRVIGDAQVFEAVVSFQLLGDQGNVLASGSTMARAGGPLFGRFDTDISFTISRQQAGTLRVFAASPRDGSPIPQSIVSIALTLAP